MKSAIFASLLASAAAFAPAQTVGRQSTQLQDYKASPALPFMEYPANLEGYVGDVGFDPFRFSDFVPVDFLRESELKHGRIAMLAVVGFAAVDLGLRVYPTPEFLQGLNSITAHDAAVKAGPMGQIFLWAGVAEVFGSIALIQTLQDSGREAGDFNLDGGLLKNKSEAQIKDMKLKEIIHCRLAMLAFGGMVTQAVLYQSGFPYLK